MPYPTPPPGTRLVLVQEDALSQFGTRTEDGARLSFEWGEPDENGWYNPLIVRTDPVHPSLDSPDDEEVLFLTSNTRIYEAYYDWYRHNNRSEPIRESKRQALEASRTFIRYLKIPTVEEIRYYRQEELPG